MPPASGPLAQLAEQGTLNPKVGGSIPPRPTLEVASRSLRATFARDASCVTLERMSQTEAGLADELRRLVIERSHGLVTLIELDGTISYASPSWSRMLGWEPAEVVGTSLVDYCHPDDVARGLDAIAAQAGGRESPPIVTRRRTKDGRWLSVESHSTPVYDVDGNV